MNSVGNSAQSNPPRSDGPQERTPSARDLATHVLQNHWSGAFPVNPFEIAIHLGVQVYESKLDADLAGAVFTSNGLPVIMISREDAPRRKRFTCAHELGHFCKRRIEGKDIDFLDKRDGLSSTGNNAEEVYANAFAAQLLMPDYAVHQRHSEGMSLREMSTFFDVSTAAMQNRLATLKLSYDLSS